MTIKYFNFAFQMQRPRLVHNHRRPGGAMKHPRGVPDADAIFGNRKVRGRNNSP